MILRDLDPSFLYFLEKKDLKNVSILSKYHNKLTQPEKVIDKLFLPRNRKPLRYGYGNKRFKWVERINYPPNIKHFINSVKLRYKPNVVQLRESAIDLLLKNK